MTKFAPLLRAVVLIFACAVGLAPLARAETLGRIRETGEIRLGFRADAPPFSYRSENGTPFGLAVQLCRAVAQSVGVQLGLPGLEPVFVEVTAADRFTALVEERTDLHCGPASTTLSRREIVDFSILYFADGATVVVPARGADSIFVLDAGSRIGALRGTTAEGHIRDLLRRNDMRAEMVRFDSHPAGLTALADGDLDAYVGDAAILHFQIRRLALDRKVTMLDEMLSSESYALAMRRGDSDFRLAVDRALSAAYSSGLINRLLVSELGDYALPDSALDLYRFVILPE